MQLYANRVSYLMEALCKSKFLMFEGLKPTSSFALSKTELVAANADANFLMMTHL